MSEQAEDKTTVVAATMKLKWRSSDHPVDRHTSLARVPGEDYDYEVKPANDLKPGAEGFVVTKSYAYTTVLAQAPTRGQAKEVAQRVYEETVLANVGDAKVISLSKLNEMTSEAACLSIMTIGEIESLAEKLSRYVLGLEEKLDPQAPEYKLEEEVAPSGMKM